MKFLNSKPAVIAAGVLAAGLVLMLLSRRASAAVGDAAASVGAAVNPTSRDNLISRGINAVGDSLDDADDNDSFSLGGFIYDLTHPAFDPNAAPTADNDSLIESTIRLRGPI